MGRLAAGDRITIQVAIDIKAAPSRVWPHLVDWEHLGDWMKEGTSFRLTSPKREGVGVTAEAAIRIGGLVTQDAIEVTRWEPPELLEIRHLGWVSGSGIMRCRPNGEGTRMTWVESLEPPMGIVGALGLRLFKPLMARVFSRDLKLLKGLVEGEPHGVVSG